MAQLVVLAVVAAVTIAETIYQRLNAPHITTQGPRVNDAQLSSSADGAPIFIGWSTSRVGGQIIWTTGLQEHAKTTTQGGKGGPTSTSTTYTYTSSFAAAFGEGPGVITRIWADAKLVYDANPTGATDVPNFDPLAQYQGGDVVFYNGTVYAARTGSTGIYPDSGQTTTVNGVTVEYWGLLSEVYPAPVFYIGDENQNPDPLIESHQGVGEVPAFRGLIYCVWEDALLTNFGNRIPNIRAEVTFGITELPGSSEPTGGPIGGGTVIASGVTALNGWGPNGHYGAYEHGVDQSFAFFGLDSGSTQGYANPDNATDTDPTTFALCFLQHTHKYAGCVWGFPAVTPSGNPRRLNILSSVPANGDGGITTRRSAGIWYTLNGGALTTDWIQIYNTATRNQRWDTIDLDPSQDLTLVKVMAFTDSHDDMRHKVNAVNITET